MGITTSLIRTPVVAALIAIGACAVFSAIAAVSYAIPRVAAFVDHVARAYDDVLPEITVRDGKASIKKPQPYFVDKIDDEHVAVVIDTRDNKLPDAVAYLKEAETGLVLTQSAVVIKNRDGIRVVSLKGLPDMVLNSAALLDVVEQYLPVLFPVAASLAVIYFLAAKLFQALILALVPLIWARHSSVLLTYGQSFKIASFAMILPVLLDVFQYFTGANVPAPFLVYFVIYLGLLILACRELVLDSRAATDASDALRP